MSTPEDKLVDLMAELERSVADARAGRKHCPICDHADRTGSWVDAPGFDGMTHCRGCHGSWTRASQLQHCTGCCRTFTTAAAADIHRIGGVCYDPPEIVAPKTGKPRLMESTRPRDTRTTVEVWTTYSETFTVHEISDPELPDGV